MAVIIKALLDKQISISVISSTDIVNKAILCHHTTPVASAALGRTLTMCSMLGTTLKNKNDSLTAIINGGGELGKITVTAHSNGYVKGYVDNPDCTTYSTEAGKLDVGRAVGKEGKLRLIKDMGLKEAYYGTSPLVSGEIAEDFANYFYHSEQVLSAVSLGVLIDTDGSCANAAGVFVQVLPYCEKEVLEKLDKILPTLSNVSFNLKKGKLKDYIDNHFKDFEIVYTDRIVCQFRCDCNRKKIERVLISMGSAEIEDMIRREGSADINCAFCNKNYHFCSEELSALLDNAVKRSSAKLK
ncbi:MAG: Hsp33 family molecular chaperone HslO [Clostridia bacterium]|nr:Hsp33 family molecular chaperone HslO [Clostridia bacterium]